MKKILCHIDDAELTPSGVIRIADLEHQDRFAYIKP
jgi:hypothetical protein